MAKAHIGQRVGNRHGNHGSIIGINRAELHVRWDSGYESKILATDVYPLEGSKWGLRIAVTVATVVAIVAVVLLL